jgi:hypothetical protein
MLLQSNLCRAMSTCQQWPTQTPCPSKPTMTLPRILDQPLKNGHPLNNGHFFRVPRVAIVHWFDFSSGVNTNFFLQLLIKGNCVKFFDRCYETQLQL